MIVAVSRIPLPKTERYLCWVRVANIKGSLYGCLLCLYGDLKIRTTTFALQRANAALR